MTGYSLTLELLVLWGDMDAPATSTTPATSPRFEAARIAYFDHLLAPLTGSSTPAGLGDARAHPRQHRAATSPGAR